MIRTCAIVSLVAVGWVCVANCSDIHDAAATDDVAALSKAIEADRESIDELLETGSAALHSAVLHGHLESIRMLLAQGAYVDVPSSHGHTPLHLAVNNNRPEVMELLLAHGANSDARDGLQSTSLHHAILRGSTKLSEMLLNHHANPRIRDNMNLTSLHLAALRGDPDLVRLLISHGGALDRIYGVHNTPLHLAAIANSLSIIELVLGRGVDVDITNFLQSSALFYAAAMDHERVVALLLEKGANAARVNFDGHTALHSVAYGGEPNRFILGRGLGGNLDVVPTVPFSDWVSEGSGHARIVKTLLMRGLGVNASARDGATPLHFAAERRNLHAAKALLDGGADVRRSDVRGRTPLHGAAVAGSETLVQWLLERGADPAAIDADGETPLHLAASHGRLETATALVSAKAELDAVDRWGMTPLDRARAAKHENVTDFLEIHTTELDNRHSDFRVGALGSPSRIRFEGPTAIDPQSIRNGLQLDLDFILAAHPLAPRTEFLEMLRSRVESGYQRNGFPNVAVDVDAEPHDGYVSVLVSEGSRYVRGSVQVVGLRTIAPEVLIRAITEPSATLSRNEMRLPVAKMPGGIEPPPILQFLYSSFRTTIWPIGDVASFDAASVAQLASQIKAAMWEFGHPFVDLDAKVVLVPDGDEAQLHITVHDEGPGATLLEIDVIGNRTISREQVMSYLDLRPGIRFDGGVMQRAERALWNSGRFAEHRLTPYRITSNLNGIALEIELAELSGTPPLNQELSPTESLLVRTAKYVDSAVARGETVSIRWTLPERSLAGRFLISANGLLFPLDIVLAIIDGGMLPLDRGQSASNWIPGNLEVLVSGETVAAYAHGTRRKLEFKPKLAKIIAGIGVDASSAGKLNLGLGAAVRTWNDKEHSPFGIRTRLEPAAFVKIAQRHGPGQRVDGRWVIGSPQGWSMEIDADTGALYQVTGRSEAGEITLGLEAGGFEQEQESLAKSTLAYENVSDAKDLAGSSLLFALESLFEHKAGAKGLSAQIRKDAASAFWKLRKNRIFEPINHVWRIVASGEGDMDLADGGSARTTESAVDSAAAALAALAFGMVNELFPEGSWPWVLGREAVFVLAGKGHFSAQEFDRLFESNDIGTLGLLTLAATLRALEYPDFAKFAVRGLDSIDSDDWRKDVRFLLDADTRLRVVAARLIAALQDLTTQEATALTSVLSPDVARFVEELVNQAGQGTARPLSDAFVAAIAPVWGGDLHPQVKSTLEELARGER